MAKRLTDTEKWNDDWYISLCNDYRIIWQWLLDNCNHAGICKRSMRLLNLMCNTSVTEEILIEKMEGRVIVAGNDWFIPKFLKFQYDNLTSNRPVVLSVVKELIKNDLIKLIPESFGNDYLIIKDKSKDKDMSIVKQQKSEHGKTNGYSGNFKAQGEENMAKRYIEGIKEADRKREENSVGEK